MPKLVDHDQKRREVVDTISPLLRFNSVDELGLRELANRSGMSLGAFSHYFPSKEKLYDALVQQTAGQMISELKAYMEKESGTKPLLELIFDFLVRHEERCLTQVLILLDFGRKRPAQEREARALNKRVEEVHLDFFGDLLHINREQSRYLLTVIIGFLIRRLWTGRIKENMKAQIRQLRRGLGVRNI